MLGQATTATAYGRGMFFPQLLLGGPMVPADQPPEVLARIGESTPVPATLRALQEAWTGAGVDPAHLVVIAAWTVATAALATARFRWN